MYDIPMGEPSEEFAACWRVAGLHLSRQVVGSLKTWMKADLTPPFLEHLSFRLGNQLFFIRIEDEDGGLEVPGNPGGLLKIADGCRGYACRMPMRRHAGGWTPALPGWGLEDARTSRPVNPPALVTDEQVEMTDWELHDFAVQVVRDWLRDQGRQIMSAQGNPEVEPAIWFVGDDGPEWVVVRAARYPAPSPAPPGNWAAIAAGCRRLSRTGNFASLVVASAEDPFDAGQPAVPLWRGHGMHVNFEGLLPGSAVGAG